MSVLTLYRDENGAKVKSFRESKFKFPYLFPTFSKHTNRNAIGVTGI